MNRIYIDILGHSRYIINPDIMAGRLEYKNTQDFIEFSGPPME